MTAWDAAVLANGHFLEGGNDSGAIQVNFPTVYLMDPYWTVRNEEEWYTSEDFPGKENFFFSLEVLED